MSIGDNVYYNNSSITRAAYFWKDDKTVNRQANDQRIILSNDNLY